MGKINFNNINLKGVYGPNKSYAQSKLANVLFTRELAKRLKNTNITAYSLHPGGIRTDLSRHMISSPNEGLFGFFQRNFLIDVELGSQTTLYCALEESLDNESGYYYNDCRRINCMVPNAKDDKSAEKLWELSEKLVNLDDKYKI